MVASCATKCRAMPQRMFADQTPRIPRLLCQGARLGVAQLFAHDAKHRPDAPAREHRKRARLCLRLRPIVEAAAGFQWGLSR